MRGLSLARGLGVNAKGSKGGEGCGSGGGRVVREYLLGGHSCHSKRARMRGGLSCHLLLPLRWQ